MLVRFFYFLSSSAIALLLSLTTAAAQQDGDRARARAEFERGVEAYGRADYNTALEAFSEAYRLAPHPVVRVNIANSYERLNRPLEALFHFERFLSEATSAPGPQRREIEAAIRRLRRLIGEIDLQVWPNGARVTIDGAEQRRAPLTELVRVTAGLHTIEVELEGYQSERRPLQVEGGQRVRVEIQLTQAPIATVIEPAVIEPIQPATSSVSPEEEPLTDTGRESGGFRITAPAWIAGGITLGAAIGAGVTGGLALVASSEFDQQLAIFENPLEDPSVREQARLLALSSADRADTLALVADVLLATTLVGAGVTTFFLITTQEGGALDDEEMPSVAAAPLVGEGLAGVVVMGSF
jgi:hypothetical protein